MAGKFNRKFGAVFPIPSYRLDKESTVPGIDGRKMSKSYDNAIDLFAEGKTLKQRVMSIKTDSTPLGQPLNPETCNVFALYSLFATEPERHALAEQYRSGGIGYGETKKRLLEQISAFFEPARIKRKQLAADPAYVEEVLQKGARRARAEAQQTMALVREAVGMRPQI
jgi:tryptophanyl-tRNA synthetase